MIFVGIDVEKDKHDCFILNSEGTVLADVFTIANNRIGFETLLSRIQSCSQGESKITVGLEATGHYSYNPVSYTHLLPGGQGRQMQDSGFYSGSCLWDSFYRGLLCRGRPGASSHLCD